MRESTSQAGTATVSKPEAVRRAIAALGYRAELSQILEYVQQHFETATEAPAPAVVTTIREESPASEAPRSSGKRGRGKERSDRGA